MRVSPRLVPFALLGGALAGIALALRIWSWMSGG